MWGLTCRDKGVSEIKPSCGTLGQVSFQLPVDPIESGMGLTLLDLPLL